MKNTAIVAAAAMLLIIISVLITSFQLVIYGDPSISFIRRYEIYGLRCAWNEDGGCHAVTEHMMAYLIGEEEELSVITTVEGERKDFFK